MSDGTKSVLWSIILRVGAVLLVAGFFGGCGAGADDLRIGDCFEIPAEGEFTNVNDQDCAGNHEAEIYARVPIAFSPLDNRVLDQCLETLTNYLELGAAFRENVTPENPYELPDDADLSSIDDGDNASFCVLTSRSNSLVGKVLPSEES